MKKTTCPICGTEMDDETYQNCPYCDWQYEGVRKLTEDDGDFAGANPVSIDEAIAFVESGKNIWGEPLPKKAVR